MKSRSLTQLFLTSVVLLPLTLSAAHAEETETHPCSNDTLRGDFAYSAHGTTMAGSGLPAPLTGAFASGGTASFDGVGHFSLTATSSFQGVIQGPATVTGTYSVNSDCSYTSTASNGVKFQAVIVDHGQSIYILQVTPGTIITGIARKRTTDPNDHRLRDSDHENPSCSAASFSGNYGFIADGSAGAPTLPGAKFGPLAGVGLVDVKRDGTFTMMARRSVGGTIDPAVLPLTGTYKLGPSCTAELSFDVGFHFAASIVSEDEVSFIETDPGTALTVIAKRL